MAKPDKPEITQVERIEVDIDVRLADVRVEMFTGWALGHDDIKFVATLLRAAYGKGVIDALSDVEGTREWVKSAGFRVPSEG